MEYGNRWKKGERDEVGGGGRGWWSRVEVEEVVMAAAQRWRRWWSPARGAWGCHTPAQHDTRAQTLVFIGEIVWRKRKKKSEMSYGGGGGLEVGVGGEVGVQETIPRALETCQTLHQFIASQAEHLERLRSQCSTSAQLTQQEIRTLEVRLQQDVLRSVLDFLSPYLSALHPFLMLLVLMPCCWPLLVRLRLLCMSSVPCLILPINPVSPPFHVTLLTASCRILSVSCPSCCLWVMCSACMRIFPSLLILLFPTVVEYRFGLSCHLCVILSTFQSLLTACLLF